MKKTNYDILTEIPKNTPRFSKYHLNAYFERIGQLIPDNNNEKLLFSGNERKFSKIEGAIYCFVIDDYILKIGKTDTTMAKRLISYNCGKKSYRENGTCSTTNYKVLQSFLAINKPVEVYCYFVPPAFLEVFGKKVSITTSPSKYIESVFLQKTKEQFGDKLLLCIQD